MSARDAPLAEALERIIARSDPASQPPLREHAPAVLTAAIASLACGGAERIVLDWAQRTMARHRVRLIVLRDVRGEWAPPAGVDLHRLSGTDVLPRLTALGAAVAGSGHPVVLCHLLREDERRALERGGAQVVNVLHNARAGWLEPAAALRGDRRIAAVSRAAAAEVHESGAQATATILRHLPSVPPPAAGARAHWRARWAVPEDAFVIGMIGGVKPQKAYPRALRVLAALRERRPAWLVIVGGPTGRDGMLAWRAVLAQAARLGVAGFARLPGQIEHAARCLPAFDVLLNSSRYEGVSIATLEALAAGVPVVASQVGGQGEIGAPGLRLLPFDAPDAQWAAAVEASLRGPPARPDWLGFPAHRSWTLCQLAPDVAPRDGVLFVTANLNAGGAQRSLVNLAKALRGRMALRIAVCGDSSAAAFQDALRSAGVSSFRTAASRDCFDHAETLVRAIAQDAPRIVCFWNLDPKVKLLVVKTLAHTRLRFFDVSPGGYAFEEMRATQAFQSWVGYEEREYYARLDRLVLKYDAVLPRRISARTAIVPNGVPAPRASTSPPRGGPWRIVVSGRIAPAKFLLEALDAMARVWTRHPGAELHVLGPTEARHREYAEAFVRRAEPELGRRVILAGPSFDAPDRLPDYDIALVLGEHQGCPNAVLEAMAAGLPVVANDSGGTRELLAGGKCGLLVPRCDPVLVADALQLLLADTALSRSLGRAARERATRRYSIETMAGSYVRLFNAV
jgi:glycosyltransferase involved in cell wall biosynthesis